jgi:ABC-type multidrug transport system fused ATPase/permease subunit
VYCSTTYTKQQQNNTIAHSNLLDFDLTSHAANMAVDDKTQGPLVGEKHDGPPSSSSEVDNNTKEEAPKVKARPEREPNFKDYVRVFTYATKWDIVVYVLASIASIGAGTTMPLMNVVFGRLVGEFTDFFSSAPTPESRASFQSALNTLGLYIMALFFARLALNYINKFCFRMIGIRLSSAIRLHYLRSLMAQSIHVLDSMPPGSAASTITGTANVLQIGISEKLGTFMEFNGTIWCAIIVAFTWAWKLTLVTSSVIVFLLLVIGTLLPFIIKGTSEAAKAEAKATGVASEAFSGIRMLTACGAEDRITSRYAKWVLSARATSQKTAPLLALQFCLIFFGLFAAFGLAFWFGAQQLLSGEYTNPGTIIVVLMSVMMVVISLERIATPLIAISKAMIAACEFFTVIDAPAPKSGHLKGPEVSATQDIVLKGVTFAYPSRPHVKVLDNLDLTIEAGKNTAIVGPSGSGKSTVVGLVERWYSLHQQHVIEKAIEKYMMKEAQKKKNKKKGIVDSDDDEPRPSPEETGPAIELSGTISTGGHNLDDIDLKWWRSQIGLVQQEPFLFNDTIFKNVAYGLIGSPWENETEEKKRELVKEACQESFADEFIDRLPDVSSPSMHITSHLY